MRASPELRATRRLLFVAPAEGGPGSVARSLLPDLRERGWAVTELWLSRTEGPAAWTALRAWRRTRSARRGAYLVHVELGKLDLPCFWYALLTTLGGDSVTITAHDAPALALHPAAGLLPQNWRPLRTLTYRVLTPLLDGPLERRLLARVRAVGVLSEQATESWMGRSAPQRVRAMELGADERGTQGPPSSGEAVLMAGFLGPSKGLDTLLAAWQSVGSETTLPLWILGDTTDATYRPWLERLRESSAHFLNAPLWLGAATDEQWRERFRRAAIVVLPYRSSSPASGPLVRAMVEGRAIIMSDVPAARGLLKPPQRGLRVPPGDAPALADALVRLLRNPDLMDQLGAAAERFAAERFTWSRQARGLDNLLAEALS